MRLGSLGRQAKALSSVVTFSYDLLAQREKQLSNLKVIKSQKNWEYVLYDFIQKSINLYMIVK